ncbi:hypothetical protein, partial [Corallococcus praedator]|uniref:hypothetical protein n=1 Tax=Corallococcus praedator TaxID=2316724 RepID=UPI001ABFB8E6
MTLFCRFLPIAMFAGAGSTAAQSQSFEEAATLLRDSCAKDIEEYCYGVSPGNARLSDVSRATAIASCRGDYLRAYAMISKRAQARRSTKALRRSRTQVLPSVPGWPVQSLECVMAAPKAFAVVER